MDVTDRFAESGYGTRFLIQNLKSKIQNGIRGHLNKKVADRKLLKLFPQDA
jgi:hypothetical protein